MIKQYTKYAEGFKRTLVDEFLVEYPRKLPGARKKAPRLVEIARSQPGAAPDQGVSIDWHGGTIRCAVGQLAHVLAAIKGAL